MPSPPPSHDHAESQSLMRASAALLALAILFSALLLGALHTPILCGVAALLAVAAFVGWFPGAALRPRLSATLLLGAGVILTAFTTLQGLSLPAALVRWLSPASAEIWAGALAPLHEPGPAWTSLSLDPTATRVEVLRGVAYVAAFLVALRIAEHRRGARFLSLAIIGTALFLGMAALLHPLFGAQRVFGLYKPAELISERHIAPLLNPNHLAAYLNIGFCLTLGIVLERHAERYRPIAIAVAALLAATQLWVASRGGAVAMVFGALCVLVLARTSRRLSAQTISSVILPGIVIAAGLAMIVLGAATDAATEINSLDASKIKTALSALPLALRYPFFGAGRGAFEVAFPLVRRDEAGGYVDFTHPENIFVQWVTEWGIPVSLLGFLAIGVALRPTAMGGSSRAIGAWAAIATTVVHNLVDFSSEVPAIGVAIAVCAAIVVAGRGMPRSGWVHRWGSRPRAVASGVALATLASIAVALAGWPHELTKDRNDLYARVSQSGSGDAFLDAERQALLRHPSEPYIPFIASVDSARRGRSVIPWIERTLTLAPIYGPAHFMLASQLERVSPAQARLEYRLAMMQEPAPYNLRVLASATRLVGGYDDALELAPSDTNRAAVLNAVAEAIAPRLPATRERLDEMVRSLAVTQSGPIERAISDTIADLEAGEAAPWCEDRAACVKPGLAAVTQLAALEPGVCGPHIARARMRLAADGASIALRELQAAAENAVDPVACWQSLGELALAAKDDAYLAMAEEAVARSAGTDADSASFLAWAASLEVRRGNLRRALTFYQRASSKAPERADFLERKAQIASTLGLHAEALDDYRKLVRISPDAAEQWKQLAQREQGQLLRETMPR